MTLLLSLKARENGQLQPSFLHSQQVSKLGETHPNPLLEIMLSIYKIVFNKAEPTAR